MRTILTILVVLIGVYILTSVVAPTTDFPAESSPGSAAVKDGALSQENFSATGTLVFYPNNVEPVPYVFYQDRSGETAAKALTFLDEPPANFSSWVGARISVTGRLDAEHVIVSRIVYLSPP